MAKKLSIKTRKDSSCPIFGCAKDISITTLQLPTYEDVMKCFQSIRIEMKGCGSKEPTSASIADNVALKVEHVWTRASIPVLSHQRIVKLILDYNIKYQNLIKPLKSRKSQTLLDKITAFGNSSKRLFDICACKCLSLEVCGCDKARKIPKIEWNFIKDQRNERLMVISSVDKVVTKQLEKKIERKAKECKKIIDVQEGVPGTSGTSIFEISPLKSEKSEVSSENSSDDEFQCPIFKKPKILETSKAQMRLSLPYTAKAADLTGASNRNVAKIVNAVLQDLKIISKEQPEKVVDKNKIRREVHKNRKRLTEFTDQNTEILKAIYFDGRKDPTIQQVEGRRIQKQEEHISLIKEPNSIYFGHLSLQPPVCSKDIKNQILQYLGNKGINPKDLEVIGCDGTNVNTGWKGGAIRLIEVSISKPLQWSICLLHTNELPLRHLLQSLDGHTKGPYAFSGPIGSHLQNCEKLPIVAFKIIICELPEVPVNDLSTDQQYLYEICCAIRDGECCEQLAKKNPGKMSHARWLTTANRVLRLYLATLSPSENLRILTTFILKVYAPTWFQVKTKPLLTHGAVHFWKAIKASRDFPEAVIQIINKVFSTNGYLAHPENILISMLTDSRPNIRELAVRRIQNARKRVTTDDIRIFRVPKINFSAEDYTDLINWQSCVITEPPMTLKYSDGDLQNIITNKIIPNFEKFPCHTQAVERCVKLVTEASQKVCGETSREGYIRAKLEARSELPVFDHKGQYYKYNN